MFWYRFFLTFYSGKNELKNSFGTGGSNKMFKFSSTCSGDFWPTKGAMTDSCGNDLTNWRSFWGFDDKPEKLGTFFEKSLVCKSGTEPKTPI